MNTIIIPSDFSMESLQVAEAVIRNETADTRIIFTHLFHVADDIQDLLFSNYRKKEYEFISETFRLECKLLKDMNPHLKVVKTEFFYGGTLAAFKNFLEYNDAVSIAYSESYGVPKLSKSSIDAMPVIKKCRLPLINTDLIQQPAFSGMEQK